MERSRFSNTREWFRIEKKIVNAFYWNHGYVTLQGTGSRYTPLYPRGRYYMVYKCAKLIKKISLLTGWYMNHSYDRYIYIANKRVEPMPPINIQQNIHFPVTWCTCSLINHSLYAFWYSDYFFSDFTSLIRLYGEAYTAPMEALLIPVCCFSRIRWGFFVVR